MNSYLRLIRRYLKARKLGFSFRGTSYSHPPSRVRLNGKPIGVSYPNDRGYLYDIVNIWLDDEYGLSSLDQAPATIVDIGANIGLFSLLAWHTFPAARIFSYEPNHRIFSYTQSNLKGTSVVAIESGVSHEDGRCVMIDDSDSRLAVSASDPAGDCELRSLRRVVEEAGGKIDLLKVDCEGAEWSIFKDSEALRCAEKIRMEYHLIGDHSIEDLTSVVRSTGFSIRHLLPLGDYGIVWLQRV